MNRTSLLTGLGSAAERSHHFFSAASGPPVSCQMSNASVLSGGRRSAAKRKSRGRLNRRRASSTAEHGRFSFVSGGAAILAARRAECLPHACSENARRASTSECRVRGSITYRNRAPEVSTSAAASGIALAYPCDEPLRGRQYRQLVAREAVSGRTVKSRRTQAAAPAQPRSAMSPSIWASSLSRYVVCVGAGIAVGALGLFSFQVLQSRSVPPAAQPAAPIPASYYDLLAMPPDELTGVDIALMNLLCAQGLPGGENLDVPAVLKQLDEWAARCPPEIERHLYRAKDPQYADLFQGSENRVRIYLMVQVLQEDLGVRYNPERIYTPDFTDARDVFIHGMLPGANGGTCASMPVLYTAIARRLGYPVKLVQAREHLFCRWDDGAERFNIEGAGEGLNFYPDEHYRTWPKPLSAAELASGVFLASMTPQQELANFLHDRGIVMHANGRLAEARVAFAESLRLEPRSANTLAALQVVSGVGRTPIPSVRDRDADPWLRQFGVPDPVPGAPQIPPSGGAPPGPPRKGVLPPGGPKIP